MKVKERTKNSGVTPTEATRALAGAGAGNRHTHTPKKTKTNTDRHVSIPSEAYLRIANPLYLITGAER